MKFSQIIKKIKHDTWWSEEAPSNYQFTIAAWRSFIVQNLVFKTKFLSICVAIFKDDFSFEKTSEQEKLQQFYTVLNCYKKSKAIVRRYFIDYLRSRKEFFRLGYRAIKDAAELSDEELAEVYGKVYEFGVLHFANSVIPESADVYGEQALLSDFRRAVKQKIPDIQLNSYSIVLATNPMLSFMERERLDFLKLALTKRPDFNKFSQKYYWMQNNYLAAKFLDAKYFVAVLKQLKKNKTRREIIREISALSAKSLKLKQEQTRIQRKLKMPSEMKLIFELLRLYSKWTDERKFGSIHMVYFIDTLLREISKRVGITKSKLGYYLPEELQKLLISRRGALSDKKLAERRKLSVYITTTEQKPFKEYLFIGKKARQIFCLFQTNQAKEIKGFVASAPVEKLKGIAQIIINPHKEKFIAGRILVTTMTRPDFMPLMRQAVAIITDEGGITSHAAIISRELGIPCIIGTKVASKVFKTGDRIEIDTRSGIIKKI